MDTLNLDFDRAQRCGFPEVICGHNKTTEECLNAVQQLHQRHGKVLITRCRDESLEALKATYPEGQAGQRTGIFLLGHTPAEHGPVAVVSAGTSDGIVAEEALFTLKARGIATTHFQDCGVAGLHRLQKVLPDIRQHVCIIAIAGMEAALISVLAGLVDKPLIACPTSVGYGVTEGGHTALKACLGTCAPGVTVVNIDNGFGAAYAAANIARLLPLQAL